jgi:hypothetical protein
MSHQNMGFTSRDSTPPSGPKLRRYRLPAPDQEGNRISILAFGLLEWTFVAVLVVLVGAAALFALFMVAQLFRNPRRS